MPRRSEPVKKIAWYPQIETESFRPKIQKLMSACPEFLRLSDQQHHQMVDDLVDAVGFCHVGLAEIIEGKRSKPAAWTMDIFVFDVCEALAKAGIKPTMAADRSRSLAQGFAADVARACGLRPSGELFTQMQRAREIVRIKH